ncbi:sigma-E factor negative regulatory protein [Pseudoalteromonas sp. T1lg65]|uniref:sigma-E factor negative regulatory protein n=1 Tax=Pseudoalteromonas sp. T1lg65 TaxID=2077101 RepID=UPI003F7AB119
MAQTEYKVTEDQTTSCILDDDLSLTPNSESRFDEKKFSRYALIGDVMRTEKQQGPCIDITSSFAQALADEKPHTMVKNDDVEAKPAQNVIALGAWRKPFAQVAIAASVSLFAIMGVNTLGTSNNMQPQNGLPQLQSTPFAGGVSPVSFSSEQPALESAAKGIRELQQQRIGALVLEHQRQSRMAAVLQKDEDRENKEDEAK